MSSELTTLVGRTFFALSSIAFCLVAPLSTHGQNLRPQNTGVVVAMDWHTIAAPTFGVAYQYTWDEIRIRDGKGNELPAALDLQVKNIELGIFDLTTKPIAVPSSGMIITFTRSVEMHPTDAERSTMLGNDPQDKCRNAADGAMRAVFNQRVDVIDATTGKVLMQEADWYRIGITRHQTLNDIINSNQISIDLSPFAGKNVVLRARIISGYNGRGPASVTSPTVTSLQICLHPQDFK